MLKVEEKVQGYNVTVITGMESEENLSSNVFLTIYGTKADSGRRKLNDDPGHFDQVRLGYHYIYNSIDILK